MDIADLIFNEEDRAKVLSGLSQASNDFRKALEHDPGNKNIKRELEELEADIKHLNDYEIL